MKKKPVLVVDHLRTTCIQIDGKLVRRHCFGWHNRENGGEVKLLIELLNSRGRVQHTATVDVRPMRRVSNSHIIIEEAHATMPVRFRYRTGQGWDISQSALGEFLGDCYDDESVAAEAKPV